MKSLEIFDANNELCTLNTVPNRSYAGISARVHSQHRRLLCTAGEHGRATRGAYLHPYFNRIVWPCLVPVGREVPANYLENIKLAG